MNKYELKENTKHGIDTFPLNIYVASISDKKNIFECHWHDEIEFIFITEGNGTFRINEKLYEVSKGQVLIINNGELHIGYLLNSKNCAFISIVFDLNFLSSATVDIIQQKYIQPIINQTHKMANCLSGIESWEKEVYLLGCECAEYFQKKSETYELFIKSSLLRIIAILFYNHKVLVSEGLNPSIHRLKLIFDYIHNNYKKKITNKELADVIFLSKGQFCRFFKQYTGVTCTEYINKHRSSMAAKMLMSGNVNVSEAALENGFENISYFIRVFRKYTGSSPGKYRDLN